MKICLVCGEYPPGLHGGIGTMTQVLSRALARRGHDVRVVGVYPREYPAPDFEIDEGVRVWRIRESIYYGGWIASRIKLFRRISRWANAGQIDIIEVPDYQGWAAGWTKLEVPVIVRLHGSLTYFAAELQRPINKVWRWLERASLRRADFVCSVCKYTSQMTRQVFNLDLKDPAIIYNPVERVEDLANTPRVKNRVVFSGTLTAKKGIVSLIRAWTTVLKSHPDAELHIFGKDARADDGQSMTALLNSLLNGSRTSVHFHGHVPRQTLLEVYRTSGAAVFPSRAEAFAIAPLEAMASGCPTIYSMRGSGPELMDDGSDGLLVDPDDPAQIAESIIRLQSDPAFAGQLGNAGRARVREKFSIEKITADNVAFYQSCVHDFQTRQRQAR